MEFKRSMRLVHVLHIRLIIGLVQIWSSKVFSDNMGHNCPCRAVDTPYGWGYPVLQFARWSLAVPRPWVVVRLVVDVVVTRSTSTLTVQVPVPQLQKCSRTEPRKWKWNRLGFHEGFGEFGPLGRWHFASGWLILDWSLLYWSSRCAAFVMSSDGSTKGLKSHWKTRGLGLILMLWSDLRVWLNSFREHPGLILTLEVVLIRIG